jgi:hypothetical protein
MSGRSAFAPQPDRINVITHLASYQLRGTCYMNAALNILVCTPCFRAYITKRLSMVASLPPGCPYDEHFYAYFFALLCRKDSSLRPVEESNIVSRLERAMFPNAGNGGASSSIALIALLTLLALPLSTQVLAAAPAPAPPSATALVHMLSVRAMADAPDSLVADDGTTRFVLIAAALSSTNHVVSALQDSNGARSIVLDSNGFLWDTAWWPTVPAATIRMDIIDIDAVYVPEAFAKTRAVRCTMTVLPNTTTSKAACKRRYNTIKDLVVSYQ